MCGMTGFFCWSSKRPDVATLKQLLLYQTPRGTDACGMAFTEDGQIHIRKESMKPAEFISAVEPALWARLANASFGLLHARNKTTGTLTSDSNHPVHKWGWVVTHNGTIKNDDDLFTHYKEDRFADVDTAAVPLVLKQGSSYEDSLRYLSLLDGNATMVILNTQHVDRVTLVRLGIYDLFLFYDPSRAIVYWSSLPSAATCLPGLSVGNIVFTAMSKLPEDRIVVLSPGKTTTTYKVTRNPFSIPRMTSIAPRKSLVGGTGGSTNQGASSKQIEPLSCPYFHGFPDRTIHHVQHGDPTITVRGVPELNQVERGLNAYNLENIRTWMIANHHDKLEVPTIYGRWIFELTRAGQSSPDVDIWQALTREFKGRKSQKRMFHRCGQKVEIPTFKPTLDNLLPFDTYNIVHHVSPTVVNTILGWACPWCGVALSVANWETIPRPCPFCGVESRRP